MKICQVGDKLLHAEGQTDMTKLIFNFRNVRRKVIRSLQISIFFHKV